MDVDGPSESGEIDQSLLLQFSCMNTSDRDELISQMQRLLGPNLNYCTASFFLDMTNWNLQEAICSYLDYCTGPRTPSAPSTASVSNLPSMAIRSRPTEVPVVAIGAVFQQTFTIENNGTEQWPENCRIEQTEGTKLGSLTYNIPALMPGQSTSVTLMLMAPYTIETHTGVFHLVTERGLTCGEPLTVSVNVECDMTMALVQQLAALPVPSGRMEEATNQTPQPEDKMC